MVWTSTLGTITGDHLSSEVNYGGIFNFSGEWQIDGDVVTASAYDINKIDELNISILDSIDIDDEGIVFSDGDSLEVGGRYLYWDNTNRRMGLLTKNPAATFSIGTNSEFRIQSDGDVVMADHTLMDLSNILHDDTSIQGFRLPISATPSAMTAAGSGYLAYDTDSNAVVFYNGITWQNISATIALQDAYVAGNTIQLSAAQGDLYIYDDAGIDMLFLEEGTGKIGIGTTAP